MIYIWVFPEETKNKEIGVYLDKLSPDRFLLMESRPLLDNEFQSIPNIEFEVTKNQMRKFDCLSNNTLVPLVNQRVRLLLENVASTDVQFLPAKLLCSDGELDGYFFVNVISKVAAVDYDKSDIMLIKVPDTEDLNLMNHPVYKPNALGEHLLARDQDHDSDILVSPKIKELFERHKITGAWIARPEDFY